MNIKLVSVILFLLISVNCFAASDLDSISFSTYYPAPYGYYNEMKVQKMAVGTVNSTVVPPRDGQLFVDRSVIFNPQASLSDIQNLPNPQRGEVAYAASEDKFYYNNTGNSAGWVRQSGGENGTSYLAIGTDKCDDTAGYHLAYTGVVIQGWYYAQGAGTTCMAGDMSHWTSYPYNSCTWSAGGGYYLCDGPGAQIICAMCVK